MTDTRPSTAAQDSRRLGGGAIATLVGLGLIVVVVLQNRQTVRVNFLFWHGYWPLWTFAVIMAVLGALAWFGLGVLRRRRRRRERRERRD